MTNEGKHGDREHLSPGLIRDYLKGKLDRASMHAIEAHLLECDFCNDAVEGMELSEKARVSDRSLLALRKRLNERMKAHQPPPSVRWPAWTAAAAIALAIAGYVLIVQVENAERRSEQTLAIVQPGEGDTLLIYLPADGEALVNEDLLAATSTRRTGTAAPQRKGDSEAAEAPSRPPEKETPEAAAPADSIPVARLDSLRVAAHVPGKAEVDAQIPRRESNKQLRIGGPVKRSDTLPADSADDKKIVVGYSPPAVPSTGRTAYSRYLADSLRYPAQALEKKIEGVVLVQFTVRPSGRLAAFKVVQSLGHGCDEEAVRLIREGPPWKPLVRRHGQVQPATVTQAVFFKLPQ